MRPAILHNETAMQVIIHTNQISTTTVRISQSAADMIGVNENRHSNPRVENVKALAAALVSVCEEIREEDAPFAEGSGRTASVAITHTEAAALFAVKAAALQKSQPKD